MIGIIRTLHCDNEQCGRWTEQTDDSATTIRRRAQRKGWTRTWANLPQRGGQRVKADFCPRCSANVAAGQVGGGQTGTGRPA